MSKAKRMSMNQKINIIRAAVMGANDGILSVAGIVIGVAGASTSNFAVFISGIAGMIAGTVSMAMGEYTSVNTEKDAQRRAIMNEKAALKNDYDNEFQFVKNQYVQTGMKKELAERATKEMMDQDALMTTVRERHNFNINDFTSPYAAAISSMVSFPIGSILPLTSIILSPMDFRIINTFIAVIIALTITGYLAAMFSNANRFKSALRNIVAGILTMVVTYMIGKLF